MAKRQKDYCKLVPSSQFVNYLYSKDAPAGARAEFEEVLKIAKSASHAITPATAFNKFMGGEIKVNGVALSSDPKQYKAIKKAFQSF